MSDPSTLAVRDFERALGVADGTLPARVQERIFSADFRYESLAPDERDEVIRRVLQRVDSGELSRVGAHRKDVWEKGWEENLDAFSTKGFALESLVPRFFRPEPIVRLNQDYVRALDAKFEFHFHDVVRRWMFREFMADADSVYEFGSGSAYNLVSFSEEDCRGMKFVGLDWAESAVKLANLIGQNHAINLTGRHAQHWPWRRRADHLRFGASRAPARRISEIPSAEAPADLCPHGTAGGTLRPQ